MDDHSGYDSDYSVLSDILDHQSSFDEDAGSCDYSDAFELGSNESGEEDDSDYSIQSEALELQSTIDGSSDVDIESDLDLDSYRSRE